MTLVIVGGIVDALALVLAVALWRLVRSVERLNRETTKQGESLDRISNEAGEAYGRLVEALDHAEGRWCPHADGKHYPMSGLPEVGGGTTAGEARPTGDAARAKTSCNRHDDCDEANRKAKEAGRLSDHCHDDCCEDCFGS